MTAFILKLIACIAMLIDHIGAVFGAQLGSPLTECCRIVGRLAFPLFAFGVAEGAVHTKNPKKYLLRMAVFALISQIPYMLMRGTSSASFYITVMGRGVPMYSGLSVMVTLLLGLIVCLSVQHRKHIWAAFALAAAYGLSLYPGMDYGILGVLFIFALYLSRDNKLCRIAVIALFGLCFYAGSVAELFVGSFGSAYIGLIKCLAFMFSAVFITLYDGRQGKRAKWLMYSFYPVHMIVLWGVWVLIKLI